jgi:hypothetical protein
MVTVKRSKKLNVISVVNFQKCSFKAFSKASHYVALSGTTIDLVLIDPQSVGKRTHDLMDTVNAKKRWNTICWRVKYLK